MSEKPHNAEEVIGAAISIPLNLIIGIANLLIAKGFITSQEMTSLIQHEIDAPRGEDEDWVTNILEDTLMQFLDMPPSSESDH
jgi:hypothetical protein